MNEKKYVCITLIEKASSGLGDHNFLNLLKIRKRKKLCFFNPEFTFIALAWYQRSCKDLGCSGCALAGECS